MNHDSIAAGMRIQRGQEVGQEEKKKRKNPASDHLTTIVDMCIISGNQRRSRAKALGRVCSFPIWLFRLGPVREERGFGASCRVASHSWGAGVSGNWRRNFCERTTTPGVT